MENNNEDKILKVLFNKPMYKFHIRELARETNLNPNTIINLTNQLEKKGIIKKKKHKHLVEISLNLDNSITTQKRKLFNLSEIHNSGLIDFLVKSYSPKSITLIGSYARGEDTEKSDIDIVVDSLKKEVLTLSKFERALGRKIHLLLLPKEISEEFFNNLINGIVLYGAIRK